ncbi:MotA/TolQ/ExbB proton channel family protein [Desulfoplanes sp. PS50]|jgi:biopolymer transport protein ExbB
MFEFLSRGGVLVYPILGCLVVVAAIFTERMIRFALLRSRGGGLADTVAGLLKREETDKARALAHESRSPMGAVLSRAIDARNLDREMLESVLVSATDEEVRKLSAYSQLMATIGNIAPLLGLLGTVIGLIKAFMVIQEMGGKVNASVLAGGIWEAMLTTALGLGVALPTMLAHSYLLARIDRYEARLQRGAITFLQSLSSR